MLVGGLYLKLCITGYNLVMARPRKTLDESRIIELASKGHINTEIALFLGVSHDTLERNFAESLEKGRALRNGRLQAKQYETAMRGDVRMLIWLGKQWPLLSVPT